MTKVTADEKRLIKELSTYLEPVQIVDSSGNILGHFVPSSQRMPHVPEECATLQEALGWIGVLQKEMDRRKAHGERQLTNEEALEYYRSVRKKAKAKTKAP